MDQVTTCPTNGQQKMGSTVLDGRIADDIEEWATMFEHVDNVHQQSFAVV